MCSRVTQGAGSLPFEAHPEHAERPELDTPESPSQEVKIGWQGEKSYCDNPIVSIIIPIPNFATYKNWTVLLMEILYDVGPFCEVSQSSRKIFVVPNLCSHKEIALPRQNLPRPHFATTKTNQKFNE